MSPGPIMRAVPTTPNSTPATLFHDAFSSLVVALAMMIRAWEEKLRRGLISQNRTKEADVARRRMNIVDQFQLFNRYRLSEMFKRKDALRQADVFAAQRAALHQRSRLMPRQVRVR